MCHRYDRPSGDYGDLEIFAVIHANRWSETPAKCDVMKMDWKIRQIENILC